MLEIPDYSESDIDDYVDEAHRNDVHVEDV